MRQCAVFWKLPAKSQAALMAWHYKEFGTRLSLPPAPDTSSKWEVPKETEDIEKIMQEAPHHMRRVD